MAPRTTADSIFNSHVVPTLGVQSSTAQPRDVAQTSTHERLDAEAVLKLEATIDDEHVVDTDSLSSEQRVQLAESIVDEEEIARRYYEAVKKRTSPIGLRRKGAVVRRPVQRLGNLGTAGQQPVAGAENPTRRQSGTRGLRYPSTRQPDRFAAIPDPSQGSGATAEHTRGQGLLPNWGAAWRMEGAGLTTLPIRPMVQLNQKSEAAEGKFSGQQAQSPAGGKPPRATPDPRTRGRVLGR